MFRHVDRSLARGSDVAARHDGVNVAGKVGLNRHYAKIACINLQARGDRVKRNRAGCRERAHLVELELERNVTALAFCSGNIACCEAQVFNTCAGGGRTRIFIIEGAYIAVHVDLLHSHAPRFHRSGSIGCGWRQPRCTRLLFRICHGEFPQVQLAVLVAPQRDETAVRGDFYDIDGPADQIKAAAMQCQRRNDQ